MLCTPEQWSALHLARDWELAGDGCLVPVPPLSGTPAAHTVMPVLLAIPSPDAQAAQNNQKSLRGTESKNWEIDEEERGCRIDYC